MQAHASFNLHGVKGSSTICLALVDRLNELKSFGLAVKLIET